MHAVLTHTTMVEPRVWNTSPLANQSQISVSVLINTARKGNEHPLPLLNVRLGEASPEESSCRRQRWAMEWQWLAKHVANQYHENAKDRT